jgi:branched-chain amino acid transport system substrate-binding protein
MTGPANRWQRWQFFHVAASFIAIALWAPPLVTSAHAEQVVKIGLAAPLTGNTAHLGKDVENGARLAIEQINAKGLVIGGQKVVLKLDPQDDNADPRIATQVANRFADEKVAAVVGHLNSGASIASSRIYKDANIVQITPSATTAALTQQGYKTTYRLTANDATQGPALAIYAAKTLKIKSVAVVDDSSAFGKGLADEFEKTAKSLGLRVTSRSATHDKATDFRAILTTIKGENPDVILYGGMDSTGGPFAKQAGQLALRAKILMGDGACTYQLPQLAGKATNKVVCSQPGVTLDAMPGGSAFQSMYEKRFGLPVQIYAPASYDAVNVIVNAMKRANSTQSANILAAMPATDVKGVTGEITFDSKGDLNRRVISMYDYKNGHKTRIDSVAM